MKRIEVYIQPYNLDAIAEALCVEGVKGMSVTEVKGFGVERGFIRGEEVGAKEYIFHPKMKVEMVVEADEVERIVDKIHESLKTGQIGQGKIFISPVEDAVRTRTGERGRDAIK